MIPRFRPGYSWPQIIGQALGTPAPGAFTMTEFERRFARRVGAPYAVWFPYGRVAVQAYLETLGRYRGSRVALAAFNCLALGNGIRAAEWTPDYVDTDGDFNQDSGQFLTALARDGTGAGVVVSQWGIPADPAIEKEAKKPLLHDYALRGWDTKLPILREKDAILYSLGWGKPGGTLRGGVLAVQEREFSEALKRWRNARLKPPHATHELIDLSLLKTAFHPLAFGVFWRLASHVPAARRLSGLEADGGALLPKDAFYGHSPALHLLSWNRIEASADAITERKAQLERYATLLAPLGERIVLPPQGALLSHYPIRLEGRDALHQALVREGIFTSPHLFSRLLCDYEWLKGRSDLPRSRALTEETLHLPLYPGLSEGTQSKIAAALQRVLKENES